MRILPIRIFPRVIAVVLLLASCGSGAAYEARRGWAADSGLSSRVIEDFSDTTPWRTFGDRSATSSVSDAEGPDGSGAMRMNYDLSGGGNWTAFQRPLPTALPPFGRIRFLMRSEGPPNDLEVKLSDPDGTTFLRRFFSETSTGEWRTLELDLGEFFYGWGGSNETLEEPIRLEFTVARGLGSENGGSGWVELDEITLIGEEPHLTIHVSQVGYDPGAYKMAVFRLANAPEDWAGMPLAFEVRRESTGGTVLEGDAEYRGGHEWGGLYWTADFSSVAEEGRYVITASMETPDGDFSLSSYPFEIGEDILERRTAESQFSYIRSTRYPGEHPHADPVPGGYLDTEFDLEKWMTTTPIWTWGMARYLEEFPGSGTDELEYATDFMLDMRDTTTGAVYLGVLKTFDGIWPLDMTAERDENERVLNRTSDNDINSRYAAAMAEASLALRTSNPERASACLAAADSAFFWIREGSLSTTPDLGNYLQAAMALHRATGDSSLLDRARRVSERLLARRMRPEEGGYGRFFRTEAREDFDHQHKFVRALGIPLGLLDLAEALPADDPLRARITAAMEGFCRDWIARTAAGTPYGVVAQALEPDSTAPGGWRIHYFASPRSAWGNHGLNCDIMAMGIVAARYARLAGAPEYESLAWNQIEWVLGTNPFGFSMISGVGTTVSPTQSEMFGKGPVTGGIVNGIVSPGEDDTPRFVVDWNSAEYWKPHNAMYLALMAELEGDGNY